MPLADSACEAAMSALASDASYDGLVLMSVVGVVGREGMVGEGG